MTAIFGLIRPPMIAMTGTSFCRSLRLEGCSVTCLQMYGRNLRRHPKVADAFQEHHQGAYHQKVHECATLLGEAAREMCLVLRTPSNYQNLSVPGPYRAPFHPGHDGGGLHDVYPSPDLDRSENRVRSTPSCHAPVLYLWVYLFRDLYPDTSLVLCQCHKRCFQVYDLVQTFIPLSRGPCPFLSDLREFRNSCADMV